MGEFFSTSLGVSLRINHFWIGLLAIHFDRLTDHRLVLERCFSLSIRTIRFDIRWLFLFLIEVGFQIISVAVVLSGWRFFCSGE